ncbi:MAG: discoidin domain-containing protein [Candidatus Omnitrophica bacterium]|nr:discoidin domain-containing protein [Candidatus Omnitrophota bacterium]
MSGKKLGFVLVLSVLACFSQFSHAAEWKASASSSGENLNPQFAIDSDPSTRWSSTFEDNQWLIIDLGQPTEIKKITLTWEAAYGSDYDILVSNDKTSWKKVYEKKNGSGGTEIIKLTPVKARYVKLDLIKRATKWGFSFFEVEFNAPDPIKAKATSSSGQDDYSADKAIDGNMQSRWSSNFEDNQWWQAEFDTPHNICGVVLKWENAFTEIYNIEVKGTSGNWKKVYETTEGDGNTDIIYFDPVVATALKINCIQRGTGWGNSLWEVTFLDGDKPPVVSRNGAQTDIKLPAKINLGGIILRWDENYPKSFTVEASADGQAWNEVFKTDKNTSKDNWIYFKAGPVREFRVNCLASATGKECVLKSFEPKSGEEQATPIKIYQSLAKQSPAGYYPMWLRRVQEFWTVVGAPDSNDEGLLSETGSFEPYKGGFSVMPFIYDGKKLYTANDCKVTQSLLEDYLPIPTVKWDHADWTLEVTAISAGGSTMEVRYRFKNTGNKAFSGLFDLAVRPVQLNPIWQYGGFSPINKAECVPPRLLINGQAKLASGTAGVKMAAVPYSSGDIIDFMEKGGLPDSSSAQSSEGTASAGLSYGLKAAPGEAKDFIIRFPGDGTIADFDTELQKQAAMWAGFENRFTINIPEKRLIDVMKTNIAYILINKDGPWIKPGSRNYSHSWMRDGCLTSSALLKVGVVEPVKEWLDAFSSKVTDNGFVPYIIFEGDNAVGNNDNGSGEGVEWDAQGEYVFAVRNYVDYSGDKEYLPKVYPKVVKVLEFTRSLRRRTMGDDFKKDPKKQPYYGILPKSNSHEGYYPAMTSYWDDFFALKGFKDGVYLANMMGDTVSAEWMQKEVDDFRKCLYDSIKLVAGRDKINYIAGCVEKGDFDSTSTAIAIVAAGELEYMPKDLLKNTFDRYYNDVSKGMEPGHERTFTPYEVRSANAYFRMDQRERGLTMLRYFTKDSTRPYAWNHMAEVVYAKPRTPSYIGDMPHTWVGSGYIDAVRTMFVYDDNGKLILGEGLAPEWFDQGIEVKDLPTPYGKICYVIKKEGDTIKYFIYGTAKPPKGVKFVLPKEFKDLKIEEMKAKQ